MNRPLPETLDEMIDRVAAAITAVPADPGFSARLAPRLAAPARSAPAWMIAAAAMTAIVLGVLLATPERSTPRLVEQAVITPEPPPLARSVPAASTTAAAAVGNDAPARTAAAPEPVLAPGAPAPAIAALGPVDTLHIEHLRLHELHIAPVDVAHLEIETLDVPEIGTTDEPKE